jgi:phospholipase/carboxylesterase
VLDAVQRSVLEFLRAFETAQQTILFQAAAAARARLRNAVGDSLDRAQREVDRGAAGAHTPLLGSVLELLRSAHDMFCLERSWPDYAMAYLSSRTQQVRALEQLYAARATLPIIEAYFRLDGSEPISETATGESGVGIMHRDDSAVGGHYSLYVPEYYDPNRRWPLVVCLHGSHGRGDEYLWTWLRSARTRGAIVLSPKSSGPTWSITQPRIDSESILAMLDHVSRSYTIDEQRILLTGLSDGGTFSYLLGLEHPARFSACAPVAGVLSPGAEHLLRAGRGSGLPLHVIHGALDSIFPVQSIRSTNTLLASLDYDLTYTELPEWGHALTNTINETIVMPWFESLRV